MAEGTYSPLRIKRVTPVAPIAANRFVDISGEQATVAGDPIMGVSMEAIAAGVPGPVIVSGSANIEADGVIALGSWGATTQEIMTDANGRATAYVAGQTMAGLIYVASTGLGHVVELDIAKQAAPFA